MPSRDLASTRAPTQGWSLPLIILLAIYLVPTTLFYFLSPVGAATSLAPGTILAALLAAGLLAIGVIQPVSRARLINYVSLATAIAIALTVHFVGSLLLLGGSELGRTLLSLPIMMLMLAAGIALASLLRQYSVSLNGVLASIRWVLVAAVILAAFGVNPAPGTWDKPVFPFSEPSHLALALTPLLIHACVINTGARRTGWLIGGLALAYGIQSLTLIVGVLLAALVCLPMTGILIATASAALALPFIDIGYFADRLNFAEDTQNLSSLIYRQGWELTADAMERTSGWGVGFQQLGYAPFRSASADVVYLILKNDTNTRDGGFLLAKLVSELGVFGGVMVAAYTALAARAALLTRAVAQRRLTHLPNDVVFALCVICGFAIDMFVRNVGYFANSVLLLIGSLYILWEYRSAAGAAAFRAAERRADDRGR